MNEIFKNSSLFELAKDKKLLKIRIISLQL